MPNSTATTIAMVNAYIGLALYGALYSTVPTATAGTEISGGSPAYARLALAWQATGNNPNTATAQPFNVASGTTVNGYGQHSAVTAGTYYSGVGVTPFTASSQATYTVTPSMAVS
jgi:hypothetical protein